MTFVSKLVNFLAVYLLPAMALFGIPWGILLGWILVRHFPPGPALIDPDAWGPPTNGGDAAAAGGAHRTTSAHSFQSSAAGTNFSSEYVVTRIVPPRGEAAAGGARVRANGWPHVWVDLAQLRDPVRDWSSAAFLLALPGDVVKGFYMHMAEAMLFTYVVKVIMEKRARTTVGLMRTALVQILILNVLYCLAAGFTFRRTRGSLGGHVRAVLENGYSGNFSELEEHLRKLPEKYFFLFNFVLGSLIMNLTDWNALRLASGHTDTYFEFKAQQLKHPDSPVLWHVGGPDLVKSLQCVPSTTSMLVFAIMIGFALTLIRPYGRTLRQCVREMSNILILITCKMHKITPLAACSITFKNFLLMYDNSDTAGASTWVALPMSLVGIGMALLIVGSSTVYLQRMNSPYAHVKLYGRLLFVAVTFHRRIEFGIVLAIMCRYLLANKLLRHCELTFVFLLAFNRPMNGACCVFLILHFLNAFGIIPSFVESIKLFVIILFSGLVEHPVFMRCNYALVSLGFIDEPFTQTYETHKGHAMFGKLAQAAARMDMASHFVEIFLGWNFALVAHHLFFETFMAE